MEGKLRLANYLSAHYRETKMTIMSMKHASSTNRYGKYTLLYLITLRNI
jgi:hypothetical protein